ncbi:MAG: biotin/lipoyl-binding protein [Lachnospiraceae bacterium]|nr:biotin/lipoyl-binding protein [Lachnospiraceae bacterium]
MKRIFLLILCLLPVLSCSGCGLIPLEEELPTAPYLAEGETTSYVFAPVIRGDIISAEYIRSYYVPSSVQKLSFEISGAYISMIYVEAGDRVQPGDVLMELDVTEIKGKIRQQEEELARLYADLYSVCQERDLALEAAALEDDHEGWTGEGQGPREAALARTYSLSLTPLCGNIEIGETYLAELQEELAQRQLVADIEGTVTYKKWLSDTYRTEKGETLLEISDTSGGMFVVYSSNASELESGMTYQLSCGEEIYEVEARPGEELEIEGADPEVWYLLMSMPDPTLGKNDTGTIRIIREKAEGVLCVQNNHIKVVNGISYVYVLDENGFKTALEVVTGLTDGTMTEIISGLEEGDYVIVP